MSITKFESEEQSVMSSQKNVYDRLSDLKSLEKLKGQIPADKLKDLDITDGRLKFNTMMGEVSLEVKHTTPYSDIIYGSVKSPIPFTLGINLKPVNYEECKMRVEIGLEMNSFLLGMVQKPLTDALNRIVVALAKVKY